LKPRSRNEARRRARGRSLVAALKWFGAAAVVVLLLYGISQMSGVGYDEADIAVVDFSSLSSGQKRSALQSANRARCTCGCRMNLAQCVATDSTCPFREDNIRSIRAMVQEAEK
jgi:hypothetical protein